MLIEVIKVPKLVLFNTKNVDKKIFSIDYDEVNQLFILLVCETDYVILFVRT